MRPLNSLLPALIAGLLLSLSPTGVHAADTPKTILYGAAYYHEYMPYDRLDKDVELMKAAGFTCVRMGESTWSSWEPRDGEFEFAWMDRIVDAMHKAGIGVIMGTPTYSIPPWMFKEHPEILVLHYGTAGPQWDPWSGTYPGPMRPGAYGPRQNMDLTNPDYRRYCERIIRKLAEHYAHNPAIIGWQVDNETGPNQIALPNVQAAFVEKLKQKYGAPQKLNQLWGLTYWGQLVDSWDDFPLREGILNPGYKLEWARFQRGIVTEFLAWQAKLLREYIPASQFVTTDFGGFSTEVDHWAIGRSMDITATNIYFTAQDKLDGMDIAIGGDFFRSVKNAPYLVTETNAQTIGWDSRAQYPPYDGQLRLEAFAHAASGANLVEYWHWHSLHYGQETYWKGVLSHDLEPGRIYAEVSKTAHELERVGPHIVDLKAAHPVALLYSNDSRRGTDYMPFLTSQPAGDMPWHHPQGYDLEMQRLYGALYRLNAGVDFIFPDTEDLSQYKVIVVPPLYVASDALLARLVEYVRGGGHLVLTLKSGFCNEYSTVRATMAPGPLREAAGIRYQEFSNLARPLALRDDPLHAGAQNQVSDWAEMLLPDTAKPVAWYDHPFFGKYPAITENHFGKGMVTYEGTVLSATLQQKLLERVFEQANLAGPDLKLPGEYSLSAKC